MSNNEIAEKAAVAAAEKWLELVDGGQTTASWEQTASLFKAAVTAEQWNSAVTAARAPLGKVISRHLKSQSYAEELPGAPDGEYVVLTFETTFEKKQNGVETITPMKDTDGEWRVAGYFIK